MARDGVILTPEQCRAARAFLDWNRQKLAATSEVAQATISDFERGKRRPHNRTLRDIRAAFEAAGIEFLDGLRPGLRAAGTQ